MSRWFCGVVLSLALVVNVLGQRNQPTPTAAPGTSATPTPAPPRQPMWRCDLPGGNYNVALNSVVSVSRHEYTVDNVARVTEVNVDTTGSMVVRFYFLEPNIPTTPLGLGQVTLEKAQEMVKEAVDKSGQNDIWRKVVKNYPTTTHARTIEFRLENKAQLDQIYDSAEKAFRTRESGTVKIQ
jgi:hypothetical protein